MTSHVLIKNENAGGGFKWTRDAKFADPLDIIISA